MNDLATIDPTEALERATDPGEFVVMALERGKSWLAEALAHGDLDALVNAKGYAETLRVATMQKQLGKDAMLSATELVRRAERCIGLGVRRGQEAGEIRRHGDPPPPPMAPYERTRGGRVEMVSVPHAAVASPSLPGPSEVAEMGRDELTRGPYALADDVSDDEFEEAIAEAKDEGNLSRANLVRKVKPEKKAAPAERSEWHRKRRYIDPERAAAYRDSRRRPRAARPRNRPSSSASGSRSARRPSSRQRGRARACGASRLRSLDRVELVVLGL